MWESFAKVLMLSGVFLVAIGGLLYAGGRLAGLGRLPGDIIIQKGNFTFYFPVVTCIVLSLILTLVLSLIRR